MARGIYGSIESFSDSLVADGKAARVYAQALGCLEEVLWACGLEVDDVEPGCWEATDGGGAAMVQQVAAQPFYVDADVHVPSSLTGRYRLRRERAAPKSTVVRSRREPYRSTRRFDLPADILKTGVLHLNPHVPEHGFLPGLLAVCAQVVDGVL